MVFDCSFGLEVTEITENRGMKQVVPGWISRLGSEILHDACQQVFW